MNKTIIININGIVFHIEEDAYDVLRSYMIDVKKHFGHSADSHEIVGDIENRIAEMFNERIEAGKKEVITMQDVHEVIEQMGRVSEFGDESGDRSSHSQSYQEGYETIQRKFMRDPDDRVFGGVASGIGHYFGIESRWIRLIFILLFLTAGTGLLVYLILWIVVPVARTRADRMAMRGEAPNIRNFKRSFEEEMEGLRSNFTDAGGSTRTALHSAGKIITNLFVILAKIIGVVFIFGICCGLIVLLVSIFASFGYLGSSNDMAMFPFNAISGEFFETLLISALVVTIIPLVALIAVIIRILFNRQLIGRYTGFVLLIVWLIAVGVTTRYAVETANDFREESTLIEERTLDPQPVYRLALNDVTVLKITESLRRDERFGYNYRTTITRNSLNTGLQNSNFLKIGVDIEIVKIDSLQQPTLTYEYSARGKDYKTAATRAAQIGHAYVQEGELIKIDSHFSLGKDQLLRDQDVNIRLNIPVGTIVYIHKDLYQVLRKVPLRQCRQNYEARDGYIPEETAWIMTHSGLKCMVDEPVSEEPFTD